MHDAFGNLTRLTRLSCTANAVVTTMTWDTALSRVLSVTHPNGLTTTYSYDAQGRPLTLTDANGHTTTLGYDGADLASVTDALNRKSQVFTDAAGRTMSSVEPLGQRSLSDYDALNRLTRSTDALGQSLQYSYDANGNLSSHTDARGNVTRYTYTASGQVASKQDALLATETNLYESGGKPCRRLDCKAPRSTGALKVAGRAVATLLAGSRKWVGLGLAGWGIACASSSADLPAGQDHRLIATGAAMFADARLSRDANVSCATCHQPERAFTDGKSTSIGSGGAVGTRNAPSLLNVATHGSFFWDGRRQSLEALILDPLTHPLEHGFQDRADLLAAVRRHPDLAASLESLFGIAPDQIGVEHVTAPLVAYVAGLRSRPSMFDRYVAGEAQLAPAVVRGYRLFIGAGQCSSCHVVDGAQASFTDQRFHAVIQALSAMRRLPVLVKRLVDARERGQPLDHTLLADKDIAALGRFAVTLDPADIGKFKTPSLRNVAITAPYMHDGSVATLEEAIDLEIYDRGARNGSPLVLSPEEKADLAAFLRALTDENFAAH